MADLQKLQLELETLKAIVQNAVVSWNHELKKAKNPFNFDYEVRIEDAASSKSDSIIQPEIKNIITLGSIQEKVILNIYSFRIINPEKKKLLYSYTNTFSPSNFKDGMTDIDYVAATNKVLKAFLIEAFGTLLMVLKEKFDK